MGSQFKSCRPDGEKRRSEHLRFFFRSFPRHQVERSPRLAYATLIAKFIRPALGDETLPVRVKQGSRPYEKLYAELRSADVAAVAGRSSSTERRRPTSATSGVRRTCVSRCPRRRSDGARPCSAAPARLRLGGRVPVNPMGTVQKPRIP